MHAWCIKETERRARMDTAAPAEPKTAFWTIACVLQSEASLVKFGLDQMEREGDNWPSHASLSDEQIKAFMRVGSFCRESSQQCCELFSR